MAPIVSAMKIQAVAVPTAILSAHTQFPTYYFDDYTDRMKEYIQTYKDLKLDFDAISTGFLGSEQQVDIVLDFIRHFKTDRNFVIVDPVMGDYGKLYRTYTKEMCDKMKELVGEDTLKQLVRKDAVGDYLEKSCVQVEASDTSSTSDSSSK